MNVLKLNTAATAQSSLLELQSQITIKTPLHLGGCRQRQKTGKTIEFQVLQAGPQDQLRLIPAPAGLERDGPSLIKPLQTH